MNRNSHSVNRINEELEEFQYEDLQWRVSVNSKDPAECVEVATDGLLVAVRNSNLRPPRGEVLTVSAVDWLNFIRQVKLGFLDCENLPFVPCRFGPLEVFCRNDNVIAVSRWGFSQGPIVYYFPREWAVFIQGVQVNGEFTIEWLLRKAKHSVSTCDQRSFIHSTEGSLDR